MKNQTTFSDIESNNWKHISKTVESLDAMNKIVLLTDYIQCFPKFRNLPS